MREIETGLTGEDEPSNYALALSEAIMDGQGIILYPNDLDRLTAYEKAVLSKTAKLQRYHWRYELESGKVTLEKDAEW